MRAVVEALSAVKSCTYSAVMVDEAAERKVVEAFVMNALVVDDLPAAKRVAVALSKRALVA